MDINHITELAFKSMGRRKSHLQREKGFIFYHCERVAKIAINLRNSLHPDDSTKDDVIYAGALFHDVTKGIEPHHITGAHLVQQLLQDCCTAEELLEISEIVRLHNTRKRAEQPFHVRIVQDADVLDHFGSLEIWLKFMYSAHKEENVFDAVRLWESEEHRMYLESSRDSLNYDLSKHIFDQKLELEKQFQARFKAECNGEIFY